MGVTGPTRLAGLADELLRCAVYATALAARRLASGESDGGWPSAEPRAGRLQGASLSFFFQQQGYLEPARG